MVENKLDENEIIRLKFRRQYIISPEPINCPFLCNTLKLTEIYTLYSHVDLNVSEYKKENLRMILIGEIYDYRDPGKNNDQILEDLATRNFQTFLERISTYTGRYIFIYLQGESIRLVGDAMATRKIYYSLKGDLPWFSSHVYLLSMLLSLEESRDPSRLEYYQSDQKQIDHANVGDLTRYDEIRQLMPNHFMEISNATISRFWPNKKVHYRNPDEVAVECAQMIKGFMEAIISRHKVMLPVTAGNDTRLLLAGARKYKEEILFYVNKDIFITEKDPDIYIPEKILKRLGLEFHVFDLQDQVSGEFEEIYFQNNPHGLKIFLPHIYNYFRYFSDYVNLPGNFASSPFYVNQIINKNVTPLVLARTIQVENYDLALDYYRKWLDEIRRLCRENNLGIINLFYWEERLCNWGSQIQLDKDIAQEEINPFNSRLLIEKYFQVKKKYNNTPDYILHHKIIKILWPELLQEPINPSLRNTILRTLKKLGLMSLVYKIRFRTAR